jgi:hypothetical protein
MLKSIRKTNDGGYIPGGYSASYADGDQSQGAQGENEYRIVKIDANGQQQWDARFGGNDIDDLKVCEPTSDGGFIPSGKSFTEDIRGDKTQEG